MQDKALKEEASQWVAALDAHDLPKSLIREIFVAFLLLRWTDHLDAEQEAMSVFEDRPFEPILPASLMWRYWSQLEHPQEMAERLRQVADCVGGCWDPAQPFPAQPVTAYLHMLEAPIRRILKVNFIYLRDVVRWVGELPFETQGERRQLLAVFDQIVGESSSLLIGEYTSPISIAHLVAALANPCPGERVYDPCFGSGNFLIAAWQHAERQPH